MSFAEIPVSWLRDRFSYEPETGIIRHRSLPPQTRNGPKVGDRADHVADNGYRKLNFAYRGRRFQGTAQRMAWALHYCEHPPDDREVDHRNRIRDQNWIDNLRLATSAENKANMLRSTKRTGLPRGVYPAKSKNNTFVARIGIDGKTRHLGTFTTPEAASAAFEAELTFHRGEFAL